jgi:hypothetical protein
MAGLAPAIHLFEEFRMKVDTRVKPAYDTIWP